jgi:hypothetical protein
MDGIDGEQYVRPLGDGHAPKHRDDPEPHDHHGAKDVSDVSHTATLNEKKQEKNDAGDGDYQRFCRFGCDFEPFYG